MGKNPAGARCTRPVFSSGRMQCAPAEQKICSFPVEMTDIHPHITPQGINNGGNNDR
jgi:hypothetical protein